MFSVVGKFIKLYGIKKFTLTKKIVYMLSFTKLISKI